MESRGVQMSCGKFVPVGPPPPPFSVGGVTGLGDITWRRSLSALAQVSRVFKRSSSCLENTAERKEGVTKKINLHFYKLKLSATIKLMVHKSTYMVVFLVSLQTVSVCHTGC